MPHLSLEVRLSGARDSSGARADIDGSPPGFPVPGILQARTLEWVSDAINQVKIKVPIKMNHNLMNGSIEGINLLFASKLLYTLDLCNWNYMEFDLIFTKMVYTSY